MLVAVIIIICISLVVGPILLMQPSKHTRQLADLRAEAMALGLVVKLGHLPGGSTELAIYSRPWPSYYNRGKSQNWLMIKRNFSHEIHYADHWDWQGENRPAAHVLDKLKTLLAQLPESVAAIEANTGGVSCYWNETGGKKVLQALNNWLDDFVMATALPLLPNAKENTHADIQPSQ